VGLSVGLPAGSVPYEPSTVISVRLSQNEAWVGLGTRPAEPAAVHHRTVTYRPAAFPADTMYAG